MKQVHSLMWFEENFQTKIINGYYHCFGTCNGMDYTFASDSEENARLLAESYLKKNGHLFDERQNEIIALKDKIERNKKEFEKHMLEVGERNRSKLMSIYYMLDAAHREKQTVIMYQKSIIEDLINKGDVLPFDYPDGLPF